VSHEKAFADAPCNTKCPNILTTHMGKQKDLTA